MRGETPSRVGEKFPGGVSTEALLLFYIGAWTSLKRFMFRLFDAFPIFLSIFVIG